MSRSQCDSWTEGPTIRDKGFWPRNREWLAISSQLWRKPLAWSEVLGGGRVLDRWGWGWVEVWWRGIIQETVIDFGRPITDCPDRLISGYRFFGKTGIRFGIGNAKWHPGYIRFGIRTVKKCRFPTRSQPYCQTLERKTSKNFSFPFL